MNSKTNSKKGQALVEFAIVLPVYILFLACFLQVSLLVHAKFLVNYASFCAARAAVVSRADQGRMEQAALIALSPLYGNTQSETGIVQALAKANIDKGMGFVSVSILNNPSPVNRYNQVQSVMQLTQDEKVLKVKVTCKYKLVVPLANWMIFNLAMTVNSLTRKSTLDPAFLTSFGSGSGYTPRVPLESTTVMRLTTLTRPSR